ncbi:MAG: cytochrome b5 domain-containing protein [Chloroflexota bacterium]
MTPALRTFTEAELRRYDGSSGRPVYIAYKGNVYDVTYSRYWQTGMHQDLHYAGIDLTRSLRKAPHKEEVFARFTIVGTLELDE